VTVRIVPLTIDNLRDAVRVCREVPEDEKRLCEILSGFAYSPEEFAITMFGSRGFHFIIYAGETPVVAGGLLRQREGVYRSWMLATGAAWNPNHLEVTRLVRNVVTETLAGGIAHRIETVTLADKNRARDWYLKVGLQYEATHKGYGINGEDAVTYVALRSKENG
jgi:hypothetical protein